jgi:tetratricopeptide (TPR) repeat protein
MMCRPSLRALLVAAFLGLTALRPALGLTLNDCAAANLAPDARIAVCTKVVEARAPNPGITAKGYQYRGRAYLAKGNLDAAFADFDKGVALAPKDPELYLNRATVFFLRKKYDDAIQDYTKVIALDSRNVAAYTSRATIYDLAGDADHARRDFDALVEMYPKEPFVLNNRGVFLLWQGDYDKSIADFDAVLRLAPRNPAALSGRCLARARSGKELRLAEADCTEALRVDPNFPPAHDSRAFIMFKYGAFDDALADYAAAAKLNPRDAAALYGRGLMSQKLGRKGDADMAAAREIDPAIDKKFQSLGVQ